MAPEITEGGELSAAADVWAFGMTALELFTRKIPFHQYRATPGVILRIFRGPPDRPTDEDTCSRMLDDWWDICTRCWNRDPSSRPTISEIIEDISVIVCLFCLSQGTVRNIISVNYTRFRQTRGTQMMNRLVRSLVWDHM
ncbi:hypothetical protein ID866_8223 [Astraeus odoratus]|nr:hypothetical protein ID866_8223 [Astraeus odoratus]